MARTILAVAGLAALALLCCSRPIRESTPRSNLRLELPRSGASGFAPDPTLPPAEPTASPRVPRSSTALDLRALEETVEETVDAIADALVANDREAAIARIQQFLDLGAAESGDTVLGLFLEAERDSPRAGATQALLEAMLGLAAALGENDQPWFDSLDAVVETLFATLPQSERTPELFGLLLTPGLFRPEHVGWLAEFAGDEAIPAEQVDNLRQLLVAVDFSEAQEAALIALTECPHRELRIAAHGGLLRSDPERLAKTRDRMIDEPRERSTLFAAICDTVDHDDLTFVLLDLHDRGVDFDVSSGLPRYLSKHGGQRYHEIIYLHGEGHESDRYRSRSVAAITHSLATHEATSTLVDQLLAVCRADPAPNVRGNALMGLSMWWEPGDARGFDRFLEEIGPTPDMAIYVESARRNLQLAESLRATGTLGPARLSWASVRTRP